MSSLASIFWGCLGILCLFEAVRSMRSGHAIIREGRRRGLGLRSFIFRDVPIAGPRSSGVIAHVTKDGGISYRKRYSNRA